MKHLVFIFFVLIGTVLHAQSDIAIINKDWLRHQPGVHRETCIDRLYFNADGTIKPVVPTE